MWTKILIGFDAEDETINFGTRIVSEGSNGIFETYTLASIQPEGQVVKAPHVSACSFSTGQVCVAVDETLIVFTDETCSQFRLVNTFPSRIDCFAVSNHGPFVFVAIRNVLYCLCTDRKDSLQLSRLELPVDEDCRIVNIFVLEKGDVLIVSNEGQIFAVVHNLNLPSVNLAIAQVDVLKARTQGCKVNSAAMLNEWGELKLVLVGDVMMVWEAGTCQSWQLDEPLSHLNKIKLIQNSGLLLTLTADGKLATLCSHTLMFLSMGEETDVQDFVLVDSSTALLLLSPNGDGSCVLKQVSLPEFTEQFSIQVPCKVSLAVTLQELLFVEVMDEVVRVKTVVECRPTDRLKRLLRRGKFTEAETFARCFNLNMQLVHKERVKHCMQKPQPWSDFNEFLDLLSQIEDMEFVCEVCISALTIDLEKTPQLLDYTLSRVKKDVDVSLERKLLALSQLLDTFHLMQGDVEWCRLVRADLQLECCRLLQQGDVTRAVLLWTRHWTSFHITEATVQNLLASVPINVKVADLLPWLRHFIPAVVSQAPECLHYIVRWTVAAIRKLERERVSWPDSGLEFANQLLKMLNEHFNTNRLLLFNTELLALVRALRDIKQLKHKHKIFISCSDFCQDDKKEVACILLRKVAPENIKLLLNDFLKQFMLNNGLAADTVLSDCVRGVLELSHNWWYYNAEAPWEEMVAAVIPCISNKEARIRCIIDILKMAPVPWSSTVTGIAESGAKLDHPLAKEIRCEQKMMEIKIVQKKYGFVKLSISNCNLYTLIRPIKMILQRGKATMLEDALRFASISSQLTEETYILCVQHYLERGEEDRAMALLRSLRKELVTKCSTRLVLKAQSLIESSRHLPVCDTYMEVLRSLSTDLPVEELHSLYLLRTRYGKRMLLHDYSCHERRISVLREGVADIVQAEEDVFHMSCKVRDLSELLQFPYEEGLMEMLLLALQMENMTLANDILRIVTDLPALSERFLSILYTALCKSCDSDAILSIANQMCVSSSQASLERCLELQRWAHLVQIIAPTSEVKTLEMMSDDNIMKWRFTPMYQDPAQPLYSGEVLAFVNRIIRLQYCPGNSDFIQTDLDVVMRHLQEIQCDLGALTLLCLIKFWLLTQPAARGLCALLDYIGRLSAQKLLRKVVGARRLDIGLGLALLLFLGDKAAQDWLQEALELYKQNYQKLGATAQLGFVYAEYNDSVCSGPFHQIFTRWKWYKKLSQLGIACNDIVKGNRDQNMKVLKTMMQLKTTGIELVSQFCADFEIDQQYGLLTFLEILLLSWEPQFEVLKTVDGEEELIVKEFDFVRDKKCRKIIRLVDDEDAIGACLNDVWNKLNYYNYEGYIYVIRLLEDLKPAHNSIKEKVLLLFLKKYTRVMKPQPSEVHKWLENFTNSLELPAISQWRLPFLTFLEDRKFQDRKWNFLKQELNLATYKQWIDVLSLMSYETDSICTVTVKNSMLTHNAAGVQSAWNVQSVDSCFLALLEECVGLISDLEKASACMYFVMNNMPPGIDQVRACELCYSFTLKWYAQEKCTHAQEKVASLKQRLLSLSTTHVLYKYGLAMPQYLKLVLSPQDLLVALSSDPSVVSRSRLPAVHCPDINSAVEEIAQLHNVNVVKFHLTQASRWLQLQQNLLDETCDLTRLASTPAADQDNLIRVCYLLKCSDEPALVNFLVNLVFDLKSDNSMTVRLRALQCLVAITGVTALEELTEMSADNIGKLLVDFTHISLLESLGCNYSLTNFKTCNKFELVKSIWKTQYNNPQALVVISRLLMDYDIWKEDLCEALVKQMIKYSMVTELEVFLRHPAHVSLMRSSPHYVQTWQSVLLAPFIRCESEATCIHALISLQSCPVFRKIQLNLITEQCSQSPWPYLAAALVPLLSEDEASSWRKKLLDLFEASVLVEKLRHLVHCGVVIAERAIPVFQENQTDMGSRCQ